MVEVSAQELVNVVLLKVVIYILPYSKFAFSTPKECLARFAHSPINSCEWTAFSLESKITHSYKGSY